MLATAWWVPRIGIIYPNKSLLQRMGEGNMQWPAICRVGILAIGQLAFTGLFQITFKMMKIRKIMNNEWRVLNTNCRSLDDKRKVYFTCVIAFVLLLIDFHHYFKQFPSRTNSLYIRQFMYCKNLYEKYRKVRRWGRDKARQTNLTEREGCWRVDASRHRA